MNKKNKSDYRNRAIEVLGLGNINHPYTSPYGWLCEDWVCAINPQPNCGLTKSGNKDRCNKILTELGKIPDYIGLHYIAGQICELRPDTAVAINLIRDYRANYKPQNAINLLDAVKKSIADYASKHPEVTPLDIYKASIILADESENELGINNDFI